MSRFRAWLEADGNWRFNVSDTYHYRTRWDGIRLVMERRDLDGLTPIWVHTDSWRFSELSPMAVLALVAHRLEVYHPTSLK